MSKRRIFTNGAQALRAVGTPEWIIARTGRAIRSLLPELPAEGQSATAVVHRPPAWVQVSADVRRGFPFTVSIESSSQCNLTCIMCPLTLGTSSTSGVDTFLTSDVWQSLVSEFDSRVDMVMFGGFGEPTLNKRLPSMLLDLDRAGISMSFSTNGIATPTSLIETLPKLKHLAAINVSIESPDPETYRRIRGGKLEKVFKTLERLSATGMSGWLSVASIAMKGNIESLKGFPPILARLGVKHYIVQSLVDWTDDSIDEHLITGDCSEEDIAELRSISEQHGITLHFQNPERITAESRHESESVRGFFDDARRNNEPRAQSKACMMPWEAVHIDANGSVFPCCYASARNMGKLGDLNEQSLQAIWSDEPLAEFRKSLLLKEGRTCPEVCSTCSFARTGAPPILDYAAELVSLSTDGREVELVVRNTGAKDWAFPEDPVVATTAPRNRHSSSRGTGWLSSQRVTRCEEGFVRPGDRATFRFELLMLEGSPPEQFQLVVDGVLWLPDTQFSVSCGKGEVRKVAWSASATISPQ